MSSMPHVKDWEHFTFGYSVLGRQIARVVHPVRGINIGQDGNGRLLPSSSSQSLCSDSRDDDSRCSVCNPGHLAQNKFASILLDETRRMGQLIDGTNIYHGESVHSVMENYDEDNSYLKVQTSARQIKAKYVVVAEGSLSRTRQQHGGVMAGNPEMQHLINVHFRTNANLSKRLMERMETVGMLHFVFNEALVGAFVCHNLEDGEWVLQIPYFPPYQEAVDFTEQKVRQMVKAGLTGGSDDTDNSINHIDILSIKPWTMSSTVAQRYLIGKKKRIILAGDAAHAFPPAGGFGMNTGIQDAHNLAWRLAKTIEEETEEQSTSNPSHLELYESERRPIASQNAALSVRNYNRTLDVAKACYLNADHPSLLKYVMESPPFSFSPLSIRQKTFGTAVTTAMMPLSNLAKDGNIYGGHIVRNVRNILQSSGGLPLLFPRFEIGFSYDASQSLDDNDDTAGYQPKIAVGFRLPHVDVEIMSGPSRVQNASMRRMKDDVTAITTTLTDVEAQVNERWDSSMRPKHSVIMSCPFPSNEIVSQVKKWIRSQWGEHIHASMNEFELYFDRCTAMTRVESLTRSVKQDSDIEGQCILFDSNADFRMLQDNYENIENERHSFLALLVRPDGHIQDIKRFTSDSLHSD